MFEQHRRPPQSWVPIAVGSAWFLSGIAEGFVSGIGRGLVGFLLVSAPGSLIFATGVSSLLYPGDRRIPNMMGLASAVGMVVALPALFVLGWLPGLGLLLGSAACFVTSGWLAVDQESHTEEVPVPERSLWLAAQVAIDNLLLGMMNTTLPLPGFRQAERIRDEAFEALELFREKGYVEKPRSYHQDPPELLDPELRPRRMYGLDVQHLRFDSGYEPRAEDPGRERWMGYAANRTAHAWVLRHPGPERPWLMCIHGFQMGMPHIDLRAFRAGYLHHRLGLNLVMPVLPLHGPRKVGRVSGDGFLSADFLDSIHAEAQAMWDLRRLLSWVRAQGAPAVGVHGLSLGGFNASLLASLDDDLACVVPGIPLSDFARITWRHGPPLLLRYAERLGLDLDVARELLQVISPLAMQPLVPKERRYIFGAAADLLVPPELVRDLWRHWDRPRIVWYQGGHVTFRFHAEVPQLLEDALRESGLLGDPTREATPRPGVAA